MGAFKTLKKSDVQVSPYAANKQWVVTPFDYNLLGIRILTGQNATGSFYSQSDAKTTDSASGFNKHRRLVYEAIQQLYYSNYTSGSYLTSTSSYDNFDTTTLCIVPTQSRTPERYYNGVWKFWPTSSQAIVRVLSIPREIYGSKLIPGTIQISGGNYNIIDDKEGNLFDLASGSAFVGNVVYPHGMIVITNPTYSIIFPTSSTDPFTFPGRARSGSFNLFFKGEHMIFENEVRCQVNEDEFNFTLNPSVSSDHSGSLRGFTTSSAFNPYVTTIGLHNEAGELIAVGKLPNPIQIPRNTDINFVIRYDY